MKNIKITYLLSALVAGMCVIGGMNADHMMNHINGNGSSNIGLAQSIELDTRGGIVDGKRCAVNATGLNHLIGTGAAGMSYSIVCEDGTTFSGVKATIGSATGTPPHLAYVNYIGSYVKQDDSRIMPGSKKRVVFTGEIVESK